MAKSWKIWAAVAMMFAPVQAFGETVTIAVATNFAVPMESIVNRFEAATSHTVILVTGSTGKIYAQILHGAPFDIFFAADQERPALLQSQGLTSDRITYATGQLVLWSADSTLITGPEILADDTFRHLAIASPDLAPYGLAARQVMQTLGHYETVKDRLVMGENIGQTYALIGSGNSELGFIARSYLPETGSHWLVPDTLHDPIKQDAVLLNNTPAARAFFAFMQTPETRAEIRAHGYRGE